MKKIPGIILLLMLTLSSCVDKDFDEPPVGGIDPPGVVANTTIAQLKTFYAGSGTVTKIPDSVIVAGIVISSDETGNFYKELVIQDATSGILIRLDRSSTYLLMPVGRRIFVKCSGLYISDYGDMIQIGVAGSGGVDRIPSLLIDQHLLRGQWSQPIPLKVTQDINSLDIALDENTLIRIDSVKFDAGAVCAPYSDAAATTNRTIFDKNGTPILLRTSNFSTFAAELIPGGTGSVIGVFNRFGSTKQFRIRDLNDVVNFPPSTCGPPSAPTVTIAGLRALYNGTSGSPIPANNIIQGVIISDRANSNITGRNAVVQDATGGIVVRFTANHTYNLGDEIIVDVSAKTFTDYNGLLEADAVPNSSSFLLNTGVAVTPRNATLADINANGEAWESTLVRTTGVTITGSGTYSGNATLTDATGTTVLYTSPGATFSGTAYPTSAVTITTIVSEFSVRQLNIRNTSDVTP